MTLSSNIQVFEVLVFYHPVLDTLMLMGWDNINDYPIMVAGDCYYKLADVVDDLIILGEL